MSDNIPLSIGQIADILIGIKGIGIILCSNNIGHTQRHILPDSLRLPDIFSNSRVVIQRISLFNQFISVIDKTQVFFKYFSVINFLEDTPPHIIIGEFQFQSAQENHSLMVI